MPQRSRTTHVLSHPRDPAHLLDRGDRKLRRNALKATGDCMTDFYVFQTRSTGGVEWRGAAADDVVGGAPAA